jgi:hypothetical protein
VNPVLYFLYLLGFAASIWLAHRIGVYMGYAAGRADAKSEYQFCIYGGDKPILNTLAEIPGLEVHITGPEIPGWKEIQNAKALMEARGIHVTAVGRVQVRGGLSEEDLKNMYVVQKVSLLPVMIIMGAILAIFDGFGNGLLYLIGMGLVLISTLCLVWAVLQFTMSGMITSASTVCKVVMRGP